MNTQRNLTRIRHNTKIVATLGPASNNIDLLEDMIRVGGLILATAPLNFINKML